MQIHMPPIVKSSKHSWIVIYNIEKVETNKPFYDQDEFGTIQN